MVVNVGDSGAVNEFTLECYFCGYVGHALVERDDFSRPIVQAADEDEDEAHPRWVCAECDPEQDGRTVSPPAEETEDDDE